jgi:hypothetical protein
VEKEEPRLKLVGFGASIGAPDGLALGAFVRPLPWLRVDGGVLWNYLSFGLQGGVTVIPWTGSVTPTFRFGIGQLFENDVRDELGSFSDAFDPAFKDFGYHFYTAQVGLEFGDVNGFQFFARGGLAWIRADLDSTTFTEGNTTITANDNDLSATTPSLQLGMLLHLW